MLNTVYRLTGPRKIEVQFSDINLLDNKIIVRPEALSICHADQRYYQGLRPPAIMKKKLPMALIHEACGKVIFSDSKNIKAGSRVVMIPNMPVESDEFIEENYLRSSKFRASGTDGFMQDLVSLDEDRVVVAPENMELNILAFTEFVSISYHAVERFKKLSHGRKNSLAVWGDGNLAYCTALLIRYAFPESKLYVFGTHDEKLARFSFADETCNIREVPENIKIDHAFECVGGEGSADAIEQIIDLVMPEAAVALMGVSENKVPVNTRMVLEKGLCLFGNSRSGRKDFVGVFEMYKTHPQIPRYLETIVGDVVEINKIEDITEAFDIDARSRCGKTIMHWNI
ncbi:MAG: alcohol dehydrogenase catalytic domain-containing protein [Eubacterium sp.]|nr:alcohol dehydrogenase catalytic domain-containing protein [Eubacterium sp.]